MYRLLVYRYMSLWFCNVIVLYICMYVYCNNSVHAFHLLVVTSSGVSSKKASGHFNYFSKKCNT